MADRLVVFEGKPTKQNPSQKALSDLNALSFNHRHYPRNPEPAHMKITPFLLALFTAVALTIEPSFGQAQKKKPGPRARQAVKQPAKPPAKKKPKTKFFGQKIHVPQYRPPACRHGNQNWQERHPMRLAGRRCGQGRQGSGRLFGMGWETDRLILARESDQGIEKVSQVVSKGVLHKSALAIDGKGTAWIFGAKPTRTRP